MTIELKYENITLVKSKTPNLKNPEGYMIKLYLGHDGMQFLNMPYDMGIFRPEQKDTVVAITNQLADVIGLLERSTFNAIMQRYSTNFPINEDGIGPYLMNMVVTYHDGKGQEFVMIPDEKR